MGFTGFLCNWDDKQHATIPMKHTEALICMHMVLKWCATARVHAQAPSFLDVCANLGWGTCSLPNFSHRVAHPEFAMFSGYSGSFWGTLGLSKTRVPAPFFSNWEEGTPTTATHEHIPSRG